MNKSTNKINKNLNKLNNNKMKNKITHKKLQKKRIRKIRHLKNQPRNHLHKKKHQLLKESQRKNQQHQKISQPKKFQNPLKKTMIKTNKKRISYQGNFVYYHNYIVKSTPLLTNKTVVHEHFIKVYTKRTQNHKWLENSVYNMGYCKKIKQLNF